MDRFLAPAAGAWSLRVSPCSLRGVQIVFGKGIYHPELRRDGHVAIAITGGPSGMALVRVEDANGCTLLKAQSLVPVAKAIVRLNTVRHQPQAVRPFADLTGYRARALVTYFSCEGAR